MHPAVIVIAVGTRTKVDTDAATAAVVTTPITNRLMSWDCVGLAAAGSFVGVMS